MSILFNLQVDHYLRYKLHHTLWIAYLQYIIQIKFSLVVFQPILPPILHLILYLLWHTLLIIRINTKGLNLNLIRLISHNWVINFLWLITTFQYSWFMHTYILWLTIPNQTINISLFLHNLAHIADLTYTHIFRCHVRWVLKPNAVTASWLARRGTGLCTPVGIVLGVVPLTCPNTGSFLLIRSLGFLVTRWTVLD